MTPSSSDLVSRAGDWTGDIVGDAAERLDPQRPPPRGTWFGWSATSLPVAPLLLLGLLLGPHGLFLLTPDALAAVDPALPVAFATLGALLGLMPGLTRPPGRPLVAAALTAGVTTTIVAIGFGIGAAAGGELSVGSLWLVPLTLGIAAASSLIVPTSQPTVRRGTRVTLEGETVVSVVLGGVLIAYARQGSAIATIVWLLQTIAVVTMLGLAGWLLLRRSIVSAERRVFAVATLLLVGGAADALSSSALLGGLCAGLLWNASGGPSRDSLQRDMLYALHPLVALVLVVAGARVEATSATVGLAAAYACLRMLARYATTALLVRLDPRAMTVHRFAPGIFGVALVLNAFRSLGADMTMAVSVVVVGTMFSEVAAYLVTPREDAA